MSEQAPAGWYPDGSGNECYWDGAAWTSHVRELAAPATAMEYSATDKKVGTFSQLGSSFKKAASDRHAAKDERSRKRIETIEAAGELITSGVFGSSTIEVYAGGFVRVAEGRIDAPQRVGKVTKNTPFEKLRSIKFTGISEDASSNSFDTSALMKGASTLVQGGKGLLKASAPGLAVAGLSHVARAKLGKTFLTITTDKAIHQLTNEVHNGWMKVANKGHNEIGLSLEEAANFVLDSSRAPSREAAVSGRAQGNFIEDGQSQATISQSSTMSQRLRELAELHRDGILSDDEFAAAKAKLLDL